MSISHFTEHDKQAVLKTIGVGGGGGNTVNHMLKQGHDTDGLEFILANTDQQALQSAGDHALVIGESLTQGLGAGAKPEIGRQAAEESEKAIRERLDGADMLFITAGMGGGTGTGAAPVIARLAREMGILTIAIVTQPFSFEGPKRKRFADEGIAALAEEVDSLITIPNDKLMPVLGKSATLLTAFAAVNDVLRDAVLSISEMITSPGMINVDFADVRTVMSNQGFAKIGTGVATGDNRAELAALEAINSPLLDDIEVSGARGLLVNICAGPDLSIGEFNTVGDALRSYVGDEATVVVGTSLNMEKSDEIKVSVVATGLGQAPARTAPVQAQSSSATSQHAATASQAPYAVPRFADKTPKAQSPVPGREQPTEPATPDHEHRAGASDPETLAPEGDQRIADAQRRYQGKISEDQPSDKKRSAREMDEDFLDIPAFLRRPTKKR